MLLLRQDDEAPGELHDPRKCATVDHVLPRAKGGYESFLNKVAAHKICNGIKSDRMPTRDELKQLRALKDHPLSGSEI